MDTGKEYVDGEFITLVFVKTKTSEGPGFKVQMLFFSSVSPPPIDMRWIVGVLQEDVLKMHRHRLGTFTDLSGRNQLLLLPKNRQFRHAPTPPKVEYCLSNKYY